MDNVCSAAIENKHTMQAEREHVHVLSTIELSRQLKRQQELLAGLLEEKHSKIKRPAWMGRVGALLSVAMTAFTYLHINVWCLAFMVLHPSGIRAITDRNNPDVIASETDNSPGVYWAYIVAVSGPALVSVAVAVAVHVFVGHDNVWLPTTVAYAAWSVSFCVLNCIGLAYASLQIQKGKDANKADRHFYGSLFRAFGIQVDEMERSGNLDVAICAFVCFLPAIVAAFLVRWCTQPQFTIKCSVDWAATTSGVAFCYEDVSNGCCKVEDLRYNYFKFVAYLSGNVLAAYGLVKYAAICALANAQQLHTIRGADALEEDSPLEKIEVDVKDQRQQGSSKGGAGGATDPLLP